MQGARRPRRRFWPIAHSIAIGAALACYAPPDEPEAQLLADPAPQTPEAPLAPTRRALWVLAEGSQRVLESPEKTEAMLATARELGTTDLFVQVLRRGQSWYAATRADDTPFRKIRERTGRDPLRELTRSAHAAGIKVHAWVNVLNLHDRKDAPLLRALGRGAVLVDRKGRSMLDYPDYDVPAPDNEVLRLGAPGIWLDPAAPGVAEYLEATVRELIAAHPDLDGLHLDFIRHPYALPITPGSRFEGGLDFGYGAATRAAFEKQTGRPFARGDAWDDFRRDSVSALVSRLDRALPQTWELSCAALPWADRAYLSAMQDWRRWLDDESLDFAVAMTYTRDDRLLRYQAAALRGGVGGDRVWLGLGTYLFDDEVSRARTQLEIAERARPAGIALFSYDAIADAPALVPAVTPPEAP